jgi:hypothetical protein
VGGSPETTLDREIDTLDTKDTPTIDEGLPESKVAIKTTDSDDLAEEVRAYLKPESLPPGTGHGLDAVIDIFRTLRKAGSISTDELKKAVYPEYESDWRDAQTMWESLSRYFNNVPGIEKTGCDEWEYTGDQDVRKIMNEE